MAGGGGFPGNQKTPLDTPLGQFWCNVMQWVDVVHGLAL